MSDRLLFIDRSPMIGRSGRAYTVLGQDDVPTTKQDFAVRTLVLVVFSRANYPAPWPQLSVGSYLWRMGFDDVDHLTESRRVEGLKPVEAQMVAVPIKSNDFEAYVFQCEAGVSRSAGLCVAVARFFGDEEVAAECYRRYQPNELVIERLTNALEASRA